MLMSVQVTLFVDVQEVVFEDQQREAFVQVCSILRKAGLQETLVEAAPMEFDADPANLGWASRVI